MRYEPSSWRKWVVSMAALLAGAVVVFIAVYAIDYFATGGPAPVDGKARYFLFDPDHITDAVSALGGMIAAVLGIVITVVSIIVQLSAERYTGVAMMFLRDRTNIGVMGYYVTACVLGVFVSLSVQKDFAPRLTLVAMIAVTAIGLVLMAPYFAYVFWFLEPVNIIARIRKEAVSVARSGAPASAGEANERAQAQVLGSLEELTDLISNSISGKDKIIASRAVDALKDFAVEYVRLKPGATGTWFELGPGIRENPDFVAMDPESRGDLEKRRTWVEWKVMRQYLGIYNEALGSMPDINYLIAIDTRYIGEAAAQAKDDELVELVFRYMNSYLRATLNAKAVRTAYNVLNQYRHLVESMVRLDCHKAATTAVGHMKYYGVVSFDMNLPFVTETVAYDVAAVCQVAHELKSPSEMSMLRTFLDLDRPTGRRHQEQALKGVRKAQVKLAAYYLEVGETDKARLIFDDMRHDPRDRLDAICVELDRVETKDFWEIIDRGRNFEYMPPAQKAAMRRFFAWFEAEPRSSEAASPTVTPTPPTAVDTQRSAALAAIAGAPTSSHAPSSETKAGAERTPRAREEA
ncbi:MAG: DUF2254 domain-containing protein [Myxococcales bacterium]|nr:DUF2254 domain-containing protein [Myxococcales bacterium]